MTSLGTLALYGFLASANVGSTRYALERPGTHETNRLGPVAGPAVFPAIMAGGDLWLQRRGHRGWAKVVRVAAVVTVGAFVVHDVQVGRGK